MTQGNEEEWIAVGQELMETELRRTGDDLVNEFHRVARNISSGELTKQDVSQLDSHLHEAQQLADRLRDIAQEDNHQ